MGKRRRLPGKKRRTEHLNLRDNLTNDGANFMLMPWRFGVYKVGYFYHPWRNQNPTPHNWRFTK